MVVVLHYINIEDNIIGKTFIDFQKITRITFTTSLLEQKLIHVFKENRVDWWMILSDVQLTRR